MPSIRLDKKTKTIRIVNRQENLSLRNSSSNIRLDKTVKTVKVVNRRETIKLQHLRHGNLTLQHSGKTGPRGPQGLDGEMGVGVPAGGLEGQFLAKDGSEDFSFKWFTPSFAGDKYAALDFTTTSYVPFNHGLSKYPAVSVMDSAGDEIEGDVEYVDVNSVIITFTASFSGRITCN